MRATLRLQPCLSALACTFLLAAPAAAQAPRHVPLPPNTWVLDRGLLRCSIGHRLGGPQSPLLILSLKQGDERYPELILTKDGRERPPRLPANVRVVLEPSGHAVPATTFRQTRGSADITYVDIVPKGKDPGEAAGSDFLARFAASTRVRVFAAADATRPLAELSYTGGPKLLYALRQCNGELLRSWGVDTAARAELTRLPRWTSGGIQSADYPSKALNAGEWGTTVARFTVGADGRASDCATVVSSSSATLDETTCRLIVERWRFDPALGADGQPRGAQWLQTVTWGIRY